MKSGIAAPEKRWYFRGSVETHYALRDKRTRKSLEML